MENAQSDKEPNLTKIAGLCREFVGDLAKDPTVTDAALDKAVKGAINLLCSSLEPFAETITEIVSSLPEDIRSGIEFIVLDAVKQSKSLACYSDAPKRRRTLASLDVLNEPQTQVIASQLETVLKQNSNSSGTKTVLKHVDYSFEYVPIGRTLEQFLSQPAVQSALLLPTQHELSFSEGDQVLSSVWDGKLSQELTSSLGTHYVLLQLYFDEVETGNALGPKAGVHKVGKFFLRIRNLPPHIASSTSTIFLLCRRTVEI